MFVRSAAATQALIDAGGIVTARSDTGHTPLWSSVLVSAEVGATLLKAGVPADDPVGEEALTPLWFAAWKGTSRSSMCSCVPARILRLVVTGSLQRSAPGSGRGKDLEDARLPRILQDKAPYRRDFDQTIAVLEAALAKAQRR